MDSQPKAMTNQPDERWLQKAEDFIAAHSLSPYLRRESLARALQEVFEEGRRVPNTQVGYQQSGEQTNRL